jgi:hypothetical protein
MARALNLDIGIERQCLDSNACADLDLISNYDLAMKNRCDVLTGLGSGKNLV